MQMMRATVCVMAAVQAQSLFMNCSAGSGLCGVLTLETGLGTGYYAHDLPGLHGLWPEVEPYGNSVCLAPSISNADPGSILLCYDVSNDTVHQKEFEDHEWEKHGMCAGVKDAQDFFQQACTLAAEPLALMAKQERTFDAMYQALKDAGYPIFSTDTANSQFQLSTCWKDGKWYIASEAEFPLKCGGTLPPSMPPTPPDVNQCIPNTHGPPCHNNKECEPYRDCLRCAKSGFCTMTPLYEE
jgi:hypothetical protein